MSDYLPKIQRFYKSYEKWVGENPQLVSDIETTLRWISYFAAGRISKSSVLSELVYSMSNIFVLINDRITERAFNGGLSYDSAYKLKLFLTTIEYFEVFLEISARKKWGEGGRWFLITMIQFFKCAARFILTMRYKEEIIREPTIPVLNRRRFIEQSKKQIQTSDRSGDIDINGAFSYTLKRSGRRIRKVEGAPPIHLRSWLPLDDELAIPLNTSPAEIMKLSNAENLYILKPIIHLLAIKMFGFKSWKSYCTALLADLASIRMYRNQRHLMNKAQRVELSRRCINMLLYLVRSPVYDGYSEQRIIRFINFIGRNIPLTKGVSQSLVKYIPQWQDTYFYLWST